GRPPRPSPLPPCILGRSPRQARPAPFPPCRGGGRTAGHPHESSPDRPRPPSRRVLKDFHAGIGLDHIILLLAAAVVAGPLFRRRGIGSVLGYLAAGLRVVPAALGLFDAPEALRQVAELGVVMFLSIIGREMRPRKLWALRKAIFGLGAAQVLTCGTLLTLLGVAAGLPWAAAAAGRSEEHTSELQSRENLVCR